MAASKIEIENSVIRALENGNFTLSRKFEADPARYAEMTGQLVEDIHDEGFSPRALHVGMDLLRKQFAFQRWPNTAELLAFLRQGEAATRPRIEKSEKSEDPDPAKWAAQMMRSQTGRQALAQGWHYELHLWAERHPGKTPQDDDVANMIAAERTGRERIGQVRANHHHMFCGSSLLDMAEGLDRRKAELLEEFRT